jgi:hypothetical protein
MEKTWEVLGVTRSHYLNPKIPMPDVNQPAKDGQPGWEDWDKDGNPGLTLEITGFASGQTYVIKRSWDSAQGVVEPGADKIKLALQGEEFQTKLGGNVKDPGNALAANPDEHFIWMKRVPGPVVLGSTDQETCEKVRAIKGQHIPEGDL